MLSKDFVRYLCENAEYNNALVFMLAQMGLWGHSYAKAQMASQWKPALEQQIIAELSSTLSGTFIYDILSKFEQGYTSMSGDLVLSILNGSVHDSFDGSASSPHTMTIYVTDPEITLSGPLDKQTPDVVFDTPPTSTVRYADSHIEYQFLENTKMCVGGLCKSTCVKLVVRVVGPCYDGWLQFLHSTPISVTSSNVFVIDPVSALLPSAIKLMTIEQLSNVAWRCGRDGCSIKCRNTKVKLVESLLRENSQSSEWKKGTHHLRHTCLTLSPPVAKHRRSMGHAAHQQSMMCIIPTVEVPTSKPMLLKSQEHLSEYIIWQQNRSYSYYVDDYGHLRQELFQVYSKLDEFMKLLAPAP